jgi:protocatechuate 3,4-dioxygenase beta subunit
MIIRPIGMRKLARFALAALFVTSTSTIAHAAITGTIIDLDGKPVAGATIHAFAAEDSATMRARIVAGKADREPGATAKSSDSGSFTIDLKSSPAIDLEIEASGHPRTTIATVDGDDIGVVQLDAQPVSKFRVTSGGKAVANAIVVSGAEARKTDAAGETPVFGIGSVSVIHPDFAIASRREMGGTVSSSHEIKLTAGVSVRGKVVNAAGPVPHAIVSINGWPLAESAADGTFAVAHAPENWQSVRAVRGNEIGTATRSAKAGAVEIRLAKGETFAGTVRDSLSGAAVAGARMSLNEGADSVATTASGAKGRFTFGPLLSRSYQIEGTHPSYAIASASVLVPHVATRAFAALPYAHARGRVIDEEKKPVAAAIVNSPVTNGPRRPSTLTNAAGEFVIRVMTSANPFALPIYATKHGYAGGMLEARKWQPGETRNDIIITLVRGFTIAVRVRDRQHQPVDHAYVNLVRIGDGAQQGFFSPAECDDPTRQDCRRTGADGSVLFRTSEGSHNVFVTGDEVAPKRVPIVALTARSEPVVVEVDRGVTISGRVVHADGTPVAGALVEMPRSQLAPRNATTDSDGTFTIAGIASGATTLTAHSSDRHMTSAAVPVTAPAKNVSITMPHGGRIEGRVVDRGTKQPVIDFTVLLPSRGGPNPAPQQVHADDGSYAIDNVTPGMAQVNVTATGYVTATRSDITAEEGKTVSGIDVQLDRGASITGRVTSGGAPVAGVQVSLTANRMPPFGGLTTDADGNYTLDGVAEGERSIQFQRTGFIVLHKTVEVAAGKDLRLDVELDHGAEIRGRVTDRAGHNIPGASVAITGDRGAPGNMVQTDLDGTFVMQGLANGSYHLTARKDGFVSEEANDVTVPQGQPLTFALDHGATITGRVTGLAPEELAQVMVAASGGTSRNQTPVDSAGNFTLHGMPDGRIRVDAFLSAAGRNRTALPKNIVVENGAAPPVELDFSEGITISGHVTHAGVAISAGYISFIPTPQTAQKIAAAQMGQGGGGGMISSDGSYVATLLAPGDYNVRLSGPSLNYQTTYTAGGSATFDIDIHGAMLRGHVVDAATGAPLANTSVTVFARAAQANGSGVTDSEGHFAIDALPDAVYDLRATREPYSVATQQVTVSGGSAPDVEVRLEQAPSVTFHVTDSATGAPVDASIMVATEQHANQGQAQRVENGVLKTWLKPGSYVAMVYARYYVAKTANFTTPPADVPIVLVRGGQLIIVAKSAQQVRLDPTGSPFPGPIHPGTNGPYPTILPGSYILSVLDKSGSVVSTVPVLITAGETTTIQLP